MQLAQFPAVEELENAYAGAESHDYVAEESGQRATARTILERIERQVPGRGSLLDLGCWVGFFLDEASRRGWQAVGVEPSEFASAYARERFQLEVRTADMYDADLPESGFRAVFLGDVIEHMTDPSRTMALAAGLLSEDGVLAMTLPDSGSRLAGVLGARWWSVIPTHVQYFTRGSMVTLLRRCGFEPVSVATSPKAFTLEYYLRRLSGYSEPVSDLLCASARAVGQADRMISPDFRDRMIVIARPRSAGVVS